MLPDSRVNRPYVSQPSLTIAITGASGFIGGALARALAAGGHRVRALVRTPAPDLAATGIEPVLGALDDREALSRLVAGAGVVVHAAAILSSANGKKLQAVNVAGTAQLIEAAKGIRPPPRFLLISSLAAREPHVSAYASSKRAAEEVLHRRAGCLDWGIIRPPAVYGPGDRALLTIFRQFKNRIAVLPGSPRGRFSLLYVDDLVHAVIALLDCPEWNGARMELDDGYRGGYSWQTVLMIAGKRLGRVPSAIFPPRFSLWLPVVLGQTLAALADRSPILTTGKLRELYFRDWVCRRSRMPSRFDWIPRVQFAEGFANTWRWYAENRLL